MRSRETTESAADLDECAQLEKQLEQKVRVCKLWATVSSVYLEVELGTPTTHDRLLHRTM